VLALLPASGTPILRRHIPEVRAGSQLITLLMEDTVACDTASGGRLWLASQRDR